jgi:hypothetical protein
MDKAILLLKQVWTYKKMIKQRGNCKEMEDFKA